MIISARPPAITLGKPKPDFNGVELILGSFVMAYTTARITIKSRNILAIALNEYNEKLLFLSLKSGIKVHALKLKEFPIFSWVANAA